MTREQIRAAWIAALRSGEYQQGRGRLHVIENEQHKYCCLGVLCEVIGIPSEEKCNIVRYQSSTFAITSDIAEQVGLRGPLGQFSEPLDAYECLAGMNDGNNCVGELEKKTFEEIADFIEQYPHLVFDDVDPPSLDASFESIA